MSSITNRQMPLFAILLSGGLLCGAWFFQYVLGYPPCQMCYWQRHAHKIVLGIAVVCLALMMMGRAKPGFYNAKAFAFILGLALLGSVFMGVWHAGVEYGFWEGPASCLAVGGDDVIDFSILTKEEIAALMNASKPPACSDSPWPNSPISMAGLNAIISLFGALVCFRFAGKGAQNA